MSHSTAAAALRATVRSVSRGLIEREALVELIALAAVAQEHVLVIGPPGTAKSAAVRRVAKGFQGAYFEYLLGRFSEPSELFGPINIKRLRDGVVETETAGMLPEAEIAFLDEVFLGSTAILNTLLGILNERTFVRGHTRMECKLRVCVGAANSVPGDESLAAFADRFLIHTFVEPIADPRLEELLEAGWGLLKPAEISSAEISDIDTLSAVARAVDLRAARPVLANAIRTLRSAGIALSDRRCVKLQSLVAAAAAIDGRTAADDRDLWPIVYAVPHADGQASAREVLGPLLERARSESLAAAASDASLGPTARAALLVRAAEDAFAAESEDDPASWRLRIEGINREIDSMFAPDDVPETLAPWRQRIASELADD